MAVRLSPDCRRRRCRSRRLRDTVSLPRTASVSRAVHATCHTAASYVTHFNYAINFGEAQG
jgi:hypothetical protein